MGAGMALGLHIGRLRPTVTLFSSGMFDRAAFDGEVGWAIDKAIHFASGQPTHVNGRGPNYGQIFEHHVQVYEWILGGQELCMSFPPEP